MEKMTDPHAIPPSAAPDHDPAAATHFDTGGQAPVAPEQAIEARLAEAEARAAEYMDLALRSRAELDNLRKRSQAELSAAHKFAIEGFAESLLPVRDSLEMALKVDVPTVDNLREGVEATLRQMASAFERHKLLAIDPPAGEKFDPNRHQAISMVPSAAVPAQHVVNVLQKGFLINERVLRPAMVTVSSGT
jgi:molecular chaperone GrpE